MPRPKRDRSIEHTDAAARIEAVARRQMAEQGAAGLSLRAIARELGITAPAIYNYFPRLEDLITALIVDAFTDLADFMDAAGAAVPADQPAARIRATALAYRAWAVAHPTDFQLIYGNPIPGYQAPAEVTAPLARRPFMPMFGYFLRAHLAGALAIPAEYEAVPADVAAHVAGWTQALGFSMPDALLCLAMTGWSRIHGLVLLELTHHIQPLVGDPAKFYEYELDAYLRRLGLATDAPIR